VKKYGPISPLPWPKPSLLPIPDSPDLPLRHTHGACSAAPAQPRLRGEHWQPRRPPYVQYILCGGSLSHTLARCERRKETSSRCLRLQRLSPILDVWCVPTCSATLARPRVLLEVMVRSGKEVLRGGLVSWFGQRKKMYAARCSTKWHTLFFGVLWCCPARRFHGPSPSPPGEEGFVPLPCPCTWAKPRRRAVVCSAAFVCPWVLHMWPLFLFHSGLMWHGLYILACRKSIENADMELVNSESPYGIEGCLLNYKQKCIWPQKLTQPAMAHIIWHLNMSNHVRLSFSYWNVQLSDIWLSFSHSNVQLTDVLDMIFIFLLKFATLYRHFVLIKSFTCMQKVNRKRRHGACDERSTCTIFGGTKPGPSVFPPHPVCLLCTPDAAPPWFISFHLFPLQHPILLSAHLFYSMTWWTHESSITEWFKKIFYRIGIIVASKLLFCSKWIALFCFSKIM
jgi:hypothetical protein